MKNIVLNAVGIGLLVTIGIYTLTLEIKPHMFVSTLIWFIVFARWPFTDPECAKEDCGTANDL